MMVIKGWPDFFELELDMLEITMDDCFMLFIQPHFIYNKDIILKWYHNLNLQNDFDTNDTNKVFQFI
jgi:hypothetical protein